MEERWSTRLAERRAQSLYRRRRVTDSPQAPRMGIDGKPLDVFCSNDYLGLANDARIARALKQGVDRWGSGSGAAHLVNGHSSAHQALEEELADWLGRERALLFSTGYMANLGIVTGLLERGDQLFEDKLNHASLIDAGLLGAAQMHRYRHADMDSLKRQLDAYPDGLRMIVTDGVFSMDGDMALLAEMASICSGEQALLAVDDAHGLGVLGSQGRGSVDEAGLSQQEVPLLMGTLGKAFGVAGAFVAGSGILIETLIQQARSYIYTTAMPAALAEATRVSLGIVCEESWRREKLQSLVTRFRSGVGEIGLGLMPSRTPIQPILLGAADIAVAWSRRLEELGFLVTAIRPPTVPAGQARLRVTLSASHDEEQVDRLLDALSILQREFTA
ncbi:MAG: 8-amino-7-oxononanoate synthase [Sedimenticolaceae bacterium]|nr:8-amino-7-oxononanoate synthase [Sedimenticolaceae bacterium]